MKAKDLAKELGISEAAISLALNNKPGVSTRTRNRVKEAALAAGMDLTGRPVCSAITPIYLIYYRKKGAVLTDSSFFTELTRGVESGCAEGGYPVRTLNIYNRTKLEQSLRKISKDGASGVILMGTEMEQDDFATLAFSDLHIILLDNHFISSKVDSVQIANEDGAFSAVNYLIHRKKIRPGYLQSSVPITNFSERKTGFLRALAHNNMPASDLIVHSLSPSIDGAASDMDELICRGEKLATCYFADNDLIAIGAIRALRNHGYRIPEDIAIVGFDDIPMCEYTEPPLTTVHVPKKYMGLVAAQRLIATSGEKTYYPVNIMVSTNLVVRNSI
ncbi:MAG: substrate-binding domain-containing protein [Lachnospiraceae bacterium]|nr:substrate-binding domain-containing protein [Lachnospiraceae bacterium]